MILLSAMASLTKKSLLITGLIILGTGVAGFVFWNNENLRAATPLVFIFSFILLIIFGAKGVMHIAPELPAFFSGRRTVSQLWKDQVPLTITKLYFRHIRNYPEWIQVSRDFVPSSITLAGKTEEGWVRILLYYADYIFPYHEAQINENEKLITLNIIREGETVMTLTIRQTSRPGEHDWWEPIEIIDVTPGDWINEFEHLRTEVVAIIKDRERDAREN